MANCVNSTRSIVQSFNRSILACAAGSALHPDPQRKQGQLSNWRIDSGRGSDKSVARDLAELLNRRWLSAATTLVRDQIATGSYFTPPEAFQRLVAMRKDAPKRGTAAW